MNYSECKTDFNKLLLSDYEAMDHCIKLFKETPDTADIYQDILNGHCIKITNKKTEYYNKIYDPRPVIENFKNVLGEDNPVYLKFIEYCNPNINEKCCNCVSVSLYILNPDNYLYLSRFIFTIEQSILNIATYLPDWIYRLYLDPSVFEAISAVKTKADTFVSIEHKKKYLDLYSLYVSAMSNIASQPNCEIYLTSCSGYTTDSLVAGKRRNSRFSGFVEDDVNINASREADGLVDAVDCYNLKVFEIIPIATFAYHLGSSPSKHYYKITGNNDENLIFTFSAGLLASKFKINADIFEEIHLTVLSNYEKIKYNTFQAYDENFLVELFCVFSDKIFSDTSSHIEKIRYLFGILPINADEIKKFDISQKYHVNIDSTLVEELTNYAISTISARTLIDEKIMDNIFNNEEYKDDEALLEFVEYCYIERHSKYNYPIMVVFNSLMHLYIMYCNNFFEYIQRIKIEHSNKFIIHPFMADILNITTSDALLIIDTPSSFNNILLKFFVHATENARSKYPKIGGSKNNDIYYGKYLKYKKKYLNIKNKSF